MIEKKLLCYEKLIDLDLSKNPVILQYSEGEFEIMLKSRASSVSYPELELPATLHRAAYQEALRQIQSTNRDEYGGNEVVFGISSREPISSTEFRQIDSKLDEALNVYFEAAGQLRHFLKQSQEREKNADTTGARKLDTGAELDKETETEIELQTGAATVVQLETGVNLNNKKESEIELQTGAASVIHLDTEVDLNKNRKSEIEMQIRAATRIWRGYAVRSWSTVLLETIRMMLPQESIAETILPDGRKEQQDIVSSLTPLKTKTNEVKVSHSRPEQVDLDDEEEYRSGIRELSLESIEPDKTCCKSSKEPVEIPILEAPSEDEGEEVVKYEARLSEITSQSDQYESIYQRAAQTVRRCQNRNRRALRKQRTGARKTLELQENWKQITEKTTHGLRNANGLNPAKIERLIKWLVTKQANEPAKEEMTSCLTTSPVASARTTEVHLKRDVNFSIMGYNVPGDRFQAGIEVEILTEFIYQIRPSPSICAVEQAYLLLYIYGNSLL
ncbi:hypothetical protein Ciccas_003189 [Cichlidogyrus casuarinus]|uniref:Uncharacterized protein n=1 Tax=Cichlidogyrus casuarinus TaxID=1844966 RepID=A0ABD2QIC8_9PLAT